MTERLKFPSFMTQKQFIKLIDQEEIRAITLSLGHRISEMYRGQEVVIISILKGSMLFAADLIREIKGVKLQIDFLKIDYLSQKDPSQILSISNDISLPLKDKHVLIIKDIIDSGKNISFVKKRIELAEPRSIAIIALLEKKKDNLPLTADFIGKRIDDQFIVGHGLDLEEYGRNLEDIFSLKYPH